MRHGGEELAVEDRKFAGAEVALALELVAFQVVGALAQHLAGHGVVLHHRGHPVLLDGADLHADAAAQVAGHYGPAALEVQLVLFDAPPPDLVAHQGAARAAVDADLADLAESVDAVIDRFIVADVGIGGDDHEPAAGADVRGEQVAAGAQGAKTGLYEHRDVGAGVVIGAVDLGPVAQALDELGQFQTGRAFGAVGAGVDDLGVDAGDRLGGLEVLLVSQANGVGELHPVLLALVGVPVVVGGDAYFNIPQFAGLALDCLGNVLTGGLRRRFLLAGQAGGQNQRPVELVVLFADLPHFNVLVADGVGPVPGGPLGDVHGLQGIFPGIPVDFAVLQRNPGHRFQFFRHRDGDGCITLVLAWPYYLVAYL